MKERIPESFLYPPHAGRYHRHRQRRGHRDTGPSSCAEAFATPTARATRWAARGDALGRTLNVTERAREVGGAGSCRCPRAWRSSSAP